ncbi:TPA: hypothetical protein ACSTNG_005279 [Serratia fonticola]
MSKGKVDNYTFPLEVTYPLEYQKENFWRCRYTSAENESLHYKIIIPLYVKPVLVTPKNINELGVTMIGLYRTVAEKPYLEVAVAYEYIKNEMNASDWLYRVLDLMGETIIHRKEYFSESGIYTDVLTQKIYNDEKMISRFRVQKDSDMHMSGANFFMIKATCHSENYELLAEDVLQSISWLELINKNDWSMAESLKGVNSSFPTDFCFYYPNSWSLREAKDNVGNLKRYILSYELNGEDINMMNLYFAVMDDDVTAQFICDTLSRRLGRITNISALQLRNVSPALNSKVDELWLVDTEVADKQSQQKGELKIYVGRINNLWFYFEMLSPLKGKDFYHWAINRRALSIIINSLNNMDASFNEKYIGE